MKFTVTPDTRDLAFSPLELRPGTTVAVSYIHVDEHYDTDWDSSTDYTVTLSGTPTIHSVRCETWPLTEDQITISGNTVTISAINKGTAVVSIFHKNTTTTNITAVSAITATDSTYYADWYYDDAGNAVPMTIVPLGDLPSSAKGYDLKDFTVTIVNSERGITTINDEIWRLNSDGTLKMTSSAEDFFFTRNLFRKGKTIVRVPLECTIEPVSHYEFTNRTKTGKFVTIDLQEWDDDIILEIRGCLWHRGYLYVLTNTGLHRFDRWGEMDEPDDSWSTILGNDLTYVPDDNFYITSDSGIKIYKVRHDYAHLNRDTETVSTRESDAAITITE